MYFGWKAVLYCLIFYSSGVTFAASNEPRAESPDCARLLEVPLEYAAQVNIYKNLDYVPLLKLVSIETSTPVMLNDKDRAFFKGLVRFDLELSTQKDEDQHKLTVSVKGGFKEGSNNLVIEEYDISDEIPQELAWRMALSYIFHQFPDIQQFEFPFLLRQADDSLIRGYLAEGQTAEQVVQKTSIYNALAAFGFRLKSATASPMSDSLFSGSADVSMILYRPHR